MATFTARIHNGNGYSGGEVQVNQVRTQSQARARLQAMYPGAKISAVRQTSIKD